MLNIVALLSSCLTGCEFALCEEHFRCDSQGAQGKQQIVEQLKRALLDRTKSLVTIANASVLGLLQCVPLGGKLESLSREIESFTGVSRAAIVEHPQGLTPSAYGNGDMMRNKAFSSNVAIVSSWFVCVWDKL